MFSVHAKWAVMGISRGDLLNISSVLSACQNGQQLQKQTWIKRLTLNRHTFPKAVPLHFPTASKCSYGHPVFEWKFLYPSFETNNFAFAVYIALNTNCDIKSLKYRKVMQLSSLAG